MSLEMQTNPNSEIATRLDIDSIVFKQESYGQPTARKELETPDGGTVIVEHYGPSVLNGTYLENVYNIDLLGPEYAYQFRRERFVLDWDDTVKETGRYWIQAHREVLESFGFSKEETSDKSILKLFGNIHVADTLGLDRFTRDGKQFTDAEVWDAIKGRAKELLAENPVDPLLIAAIREAKQMGARFAVWSSSPRELILAAIEANKMEDLFDGVIAVEDVDDDKHKPHSQGAIMAVRTMDEAGGYIGKNESYSKEKPLDMNGVWVIGDSPNDVLGGKRAGASTVWLENPLHGHNAHEKRAETLKAMSSATGDLALRNATLTTAVLEMRPTVVIRTFDAEQVGYGRYTHFRNIPPEKREELLVTNFNFARFLLDRNARAMLHRREKVAQVLARQGIIVSQSEIIDPDSVVHGTELNGVIELGDRHFGASTNVAETLQRAAQRSSSFL